MSDVLDDRLMAALQEARILIAKLHEDDGLTWLEPEKKDES